MSARRQIRASASALALGPEVSAVAARPMIAAGVSGSAGSAEAMQRLTGALAQLKQLSIEPMLQKSVAALRAEDFKTAGDWALKALGQDERCGMAWYCLAIAREKAGDFKTSLQCYESALALAPDHHEIANNLGRLAYRMGMRDIAEKLFIHYLAQCPDAYEASNNLACCQRDEHRYGDAVETLRPAINANPENPLLWNTLGTVLADQGEFAAAIPFFDEALRLDPKFDRARYNRSGSKLQLGDPAGALIDCEAALKGHMAEHERVMMSLAHATMLLASGEVARGWAAYEARLSPHFPDNTQFLIDRPRWTDGDDLEGKTLLVMGEQGLGDEVLFANILPDVIEALGPDGTLILALEKRLTGLFQRSYPQAQIGPHNTYSVDGRTVRLARFVEDMQRVDLWTPLASLLTRFRPTVASYPDRPSFLAADPERVAHWRGVLEQAPAGLKVGILWKSLRLDGSRMRFFSPFEGWRPVLATPGVTFVNLQYGDSDAETAYAREHLGVDIWTPPGIDLKNDLDEVAALTCALDLVLGPANATTNIGAACGAKVWLISTPGAWPKLGTEAYPWYPAMRVFNAPPEDPWGAVMTEISGGLADLARPKTSPEGRKAAGTEARLQG
jgi:tetratricopeptide (TPR) repeat protein